MTHPVAVVPLRVVRPRVGATALPARQRGGDDGHAHVDEVLQLEGLHPRGVEDAAAILEPDLVQPFAERLHLLHALAHDLLGTEDAGVVLHHLAELGAQRRHAHPVARALETPEALHGALLAGAVDVALVGILAEVLENVQAREPAEDQDIQQGIASQPVGPVHRDAGALAGGIEPGNHLFRAVAGRRHHAAETVGGDAAHDVVRRGIDGNGLEGGIDAEKDLGGLADAGQAFGHHLLAQVIHLEQHVVTLGSAPPALAHLGDDGTRHHVPAGQVLRVGRVALHEALALAVHQVAAFAARAFGDEHAAPGHAGGVELEELHVLQRQAGAQHHGHSITGVDVGIAGGAEHLATATGGQQGGARVDEERLAGGDIHHQCARHRTLPVLEQVDGEILGEEVAACLEALLVERMQDGVAGAVGGRAGSARLLLAEMAALTTEGTLVDAPALQAGEGHPLVLQFVHRGDGLAAHELDGVLVAEVVGTLYRIEHVPVPVVAVHIAQRCVHAPLGRHRVRAGGKHLGDHRHLVPSIGQLHSGVEAGATGTDDQHVEIASVRGHFTLIRMEASHRALASRKNSASAVRRSTGGFT